MNHGPFLHAAIEQARAGRAEGGIPIGSVIVVGDAIVGKGRNRRVQLGDPILHAEMDALRDAGRRTPSEYGRMTIYTTLSPCHMCSGAILLYGIPRVVVGESETFQGPEWLLKRSGVEVTTLGSRECMELMNDFITEHPSLWYEDIGE